VRRGVGGGVVRGGVVGVRRGVCGGARVDVASRGTPPQATVFFVQPRGNDWRKLEGHSNFCASGDGDWLKMK
jgi:hypothetical protein